MTETTTPARATARVAPWPPAIAPLEPAPEPDPLLYVKTAAAIAARPARRAARLERLAANRAPRGVAA